jgi:hypothetical protein
VPVGAEVEELVYGKLCIAASPGRRRRASFWHLTLAVPVPAVVVNQQALYEAFHEVDNVGAERRDLFTSAVGALLDLCDQVLNAVNVCRVFAGARW